MQSIKLTKKVSNLKFKSLGILFVLLLLIFMPISGHSQFVQVQEPMGANLGVWRSSIAYGDYDNDGDLDIALTGLDNGLNSR